MSKRTILDVLVKGPSPKKVATSTPVVIPSEDDDDTLLANVQLPSTSKNVSTEYNTLRHVMSFKEILPDGTED